MESKDSKRPRLDIPVGDDTQSALDSAPTLEATPNQYLIGTQPSHPKSVNASRAILHGVTFIEPLGISTDATPITSVGASHLPVPEADYFVPSTATYGEQQAPGSETTMAPSFKGMLSNQYPPIGPVSKKILGPKARAEAARKEAMAREDAFFGPKVVGRSPKQGTID